MNEGDMFRFSSLMDTLAAAFSKKDVTRQLKRAYFEALAPFTFDAVQTRASELMRTSMFFPRIVEMRPQGNQSTEAAVAEPPKTYAPKPLVEHFMRQMQQVSQGTLKPSQVVCLECSKPWIHHDRINGSCP